MATVTKKDLIDRISDSLNVKRSLARNVVQCFLDEIIEELAKDNRLEFRDFGVFESRIRAARQGQNPKTMVKLDLPPKRTVKFKAGRVMKVKLLDSPCPQDEATGLTLEAAGSPSPPTEIEE